MISSNDIGWIAGFLEGEGYFWSHTKETTGYVSANQVQREPLERLKFILGGSIHVCRKKYGNWQECFRWVTGSSRAIGIMLTIYPLMSPKRKKQILSVIDKWKSGPGLNWKSKLTHCKRGHEFTTENTYIHPKRGSRSCKMCEANRKKMSKVK